MIAGLKAMQAAVAFEFETIDVDRNPALGARYGELVPVLVGGGTELCRFRLNVAKVNEYLGKFR